MTARPGRSPLWGRKATARAAILAALALVAQLIIFVPVASAAPANDDFANAITVAGASGTTTGTNVGATAETGEPTNHSAQCCDPDLGDASVWYKWTAPGSGLVAFDTFGSEATYFHDTVLGVYEGSLGGLAEGGFNDDYGGVSLDSRVVFTAIVSTTYYIGVSGCCGSPGAEQDDFVLNWGSVSRPANDNFGSATAISGASGSLGSQTNFDATPEAGELSDHCGAGDFDLGGDSVWFSWEAPSTGVFLFSTSGTDFLGGTWDRAIAVYTGSLVTLTEIAWGETATVAVSATSGTPYTIGVGGGCGYDGAVYWGAMSSASSFTLIWTNDTTPPNTSITSTASAKYAVTFSFTGTDDVTSTGNLDFECRIDGGAFAPCTSSKTFSAITGGLHTVYVRAIDESGNPDASPASAVIRARGSPFKTA